MSQPNLVELGSARKPHGLKGEVEFWTPSGNDTHLQKGSQVWLFPLEGSQLPTAGKAVVIESVRRGNQVLLKFAGVPDRTAIEAWLPFAIHCERDQFPKLSDGEFYVVDVIGLTAVDLQGERVGKIVGFFETPAQLIFTIRLRSGEELDLPYVKQFFPALDIPGGTITVDLPEVVE